jgi:LuxR family transcriptional regulator, maltose regulon positive regulatory protein
MPGSRDANRVKGASDGLQNALNFVMTMKSVDDVQQVPTGQGYKAAGSGMVAPRVAVLRALMMPNGPERAIEHSNQALADRAMGSGRRPTMLVKRGIAYTLLGALEIARVDLAAAAEGAKANGRMDVVVLAEAEIALLDGRLGSWTTAATYAEDAVAVVRDIRLDHSALAAVVHVALAPVLLHHHRLDDAREEMKRVHLLSPLLDGGTPWLTVQVAIELARAHLALGETDAARAALGRVKAVVVKCPRLGSLIDDLRDVDDRLAAGSERVGGWAVKLTAAELRLLPYLATQLKFPEISSQLFITTHTVKSEAQHIYRKLNASSRTEAIERAVELGLLEPMLPLRTKLAG